MRTSHRLIKKRIMEEKSRITDEEFFTSAAYRHYLTDITETATGRYKRPMRVQVVADPADERIACTDFNGIFINACNRYTWSMPTRRLRSVSIEGFNAHEIGHNLFTDNRIWRRYFDRLLCGEYFPKLPLKLDTLQQQYAREISETLKDSDDIPRTVIMETARSLSNIVEDGYVDARMSCEFPGAPARGIALNNLRFGEMLPDLSDMVKKKYQDHLIVLNLLIGYVRNGEINNLSGYTGKLLDQAMSYIPILDNCVLDEDARTRCDAVNRMLIDLWPLMQRCFAELEEKEKQQLQNSGSSLGNNGMQQAEPDASGNENQAVREILNRQLPEMPAHSFQGHTSPVSSEHAFLPDQQQMENTKKQIQKVLAEETARISWHQTEDIQSQGEGKLTFHTGYTGSGYEYAVDDMERILEHIATERIHEEAERELSAALQQEARAIRYGNAHKDVNITVHRMSTVEPKLIEDYTAIAPPLLLLSRRLQRSIRDILQERRQGGKQTGLLAGKRLNQHALHRDDGRVFFNTRLPSEPVRLAVSLLVDESGSMGGNDRITRARATAIVLQDFCEKLGIPLMITGHTACAGDVELFCYADFDSADRKDRYRLMDMSARYGNRDGAALRFAAEKLSRQNAEIRLLIIICDGQPADAGYSGSAAEADLRGIQQEYRRRGVQILAAAVGEDREKIERIYGAGYLDITDMNRLPVTLTRLIAKNIS